MENWESEATFTSFFFLFLSTFSSFGRCFPPHFLLLVLSLSLMHWNPRTFFDTLRDAIDN